MKKYLRTYGSLLPVFVFFSMLLVPSLSSGQASMESLFEEGNTAYNKGDYNKAIALYEKTLKLGQHSTALYYNLGNAYYRLNNVAESIYYFEKAKRLNPKDSDIQVNSAFARNMTIDAIEFLPESQLAQLKKRLFNSLSFNSWSILTVVLLWVFVGLFLSYLLFNSTQLKRSFFFSSLGVLLLFSGSFLITFSINQQEKNTQFAILFSNQIDIWSEPNQQGELLFTLHEGTKVQLLDDLEEWQKIRISNGSEGWINNASLRALNETIIK